MLALLAPGQGSQKPGMLTPWLDLPGAAARARWLSAVSGLDLIRLGTTADADEIRDTAVTQPLIVLLGLLVAAELSSPGDNPHGSVITRPGVVTAGHSAGELTAAAVAGALSPEAAVALARIRGREMAAACAAAPTGMVAILGGAEDEVLARIAEHGLTPANRNGAGQIVAGGALADLTALADRPPAGARVKPLPVAGAFHTTFMAPAQAALAEIAAGITVSDPARTLLSNADGTVVFAAPDLVNRLVRQVTLPVRWDLCQAALRDLGVTAVIELPPAGTLTGLAKRELSGVERLPLKTPDDLPAARALLDRTTQRAKEDVVV